MEFLSDFTHSFFALIKKKYDKMDLIKFVKESITNIKHQLKEKSVDSLIWLVNFVPSLAGFSVYKEHISILNPFWIAHCALLFYVYGVGNLVYQICYAHGAGDFIKSYVNISLIILISNNTYWWLKKRPLLRSVLKKMKKSDDLAKSSSDFRKKHEKLMWNIKAIVFIFYGCNIVDALFIYLPHRVDVKNEFSMTPCFGLEPLSATPNHEICLAILCAQELSIMTVVLNYQALLLFLIDHTSAMYQLLAEEMLAFDAPGVETSYVKEKLPSLMKRHVLTLDIIDKLKLMYSMPIGINFGLNAVCISLFFYLPIQEWLGFIPILIYCFLVFFLYCYLCQRLINAAEIFERAVYGCGWEKFDLKEQKTIYFILIQSQKKVELLAADIIPVNIYTFATTLQAIFKIVTVVKF